MESTIASAEELIHDFYPALSAKLLLSIIQHARCVQEKSRAVSKKVGVDRLAAQHALDAEAFALTTLIMRLQPDQAQQVMELTYLGRDGLDEQPLIDAVRTIRTLMSGERHPARVVAANPHLAKHIILAFQLIASSN